MYVNERGMGMAVLSYLNIKAALAELKTNFDSVLHGIRITRDGYEQDLVDSFTLILSKDGDKAGKRLNVSSSDIAEGTTAITAIDEDEAASAAEAVLASASDDIFNSPAFEQILKLYHRQISISVRYNTALQSVDVDYDTKQASFLISREHKRTPLDENRLACFEYDAVKEQITVKQYHDEGAGESMGLLQYCALYSLDPVVIETAIKQMASTLL